MAYHSKYSGAEVDSLLDKIKDDEVGRIDSSLSTTSENPVQNKVITEELNKKANKKDIATINGQPLTNGGNIEVATDSYDDTEIKGKLTELDSQIEGEATARAEADAALQTQINGKQDNIYSFSADEKAAFLVSLGLGKIGVISQTQTWTQAADKGYDYVMSDLVRGFIPKSNIDLFTKAGAIFNKESGYFELNGLTDISYEEMRVIYNVYNPNPWNGQPGMLTTKGVRTCLPANSVFVIEIDINGFRLCYNNNDIEVINMVNSNYYPKFNKLDLSWFFDFKLKSIQNIINVSKTTNYAQAFEKCYSLVDVRLMGLSASVSFKDSARLSNSSILYMINNEKATSTITITLYVDVYNRCMANADILAALQAHTNVSLASA